MVAGTTTANPVVSVDLYSVDFQVCGGIDPLLLGATDAVLQGVLVVVMKDTLDVIPATAVARDAKEKHSTFSRWKSRNRMVR
jgi:hypothetical protein